MNILLIGYGKMGKTIEQIAIERGHQIVGHVDANSTDNLQQFSGENIQAAIEFTQPESAFDNVAYCLKNNIPIICGTTGWLHRRAEIETIAKQYDGTFFYASNYSVGVNLFFHLNKIAAELLSQYPDYGVSIEEIHHTEKKDAPSGTAITLAEGILQHLKNKKAWTLEENAQPEELYIKALREPHVPGTHTICYNSEIDSISLSHTAHSRKGFATGAVLAAEWVQGKQGIFGMNNMLGF